MLSGAGLKQSDRLGIEVKRKASRDYWVVCGCCLWSETVYNGDEGIEWPPEVVLNEGRAYHRRCGGPLKIFDA